MQQRLKSIIHVRVSVCVEIIDNGPEPAYKFWAVSDTVTVEPINYHISHKLIYVVLAASMHMSKNRLQTLLTRAA